LHIWHIDTAANPVTPLRHNGYMKLHKHFVVDAAWTFFQSSCVHQLSGWVSGCRWPLTHQCFQNVFSSKTKAFAK